MKIGSAFDLRYVCKLAVLCSDWFLRDSDSLWTSKEVAY